MVMKLDEPSSVAVQAQPCAVMIWIKPLMVPVAGMLCVVLDWIR